MGNGCAAGFDVRARRALAEHSAALDYTKRFGIRAIPPKGNKRAAAIGRYPIGFERTTFYALVRPSMSNSRRWMPNLV
jgi:hypothetical protein